MSYCKLYDYLYYVPTADALQNKGGHKKMEATPMVTIHTGLKKLPELKQSAEVPTPKVEQVNHPNHYQGTVECIDAINAATLNLTGEEAFDIGCAIKYLWRWKEKNGIEDLEKAQWYISRIIDINKFGPVV